MAKKLVLEPNMVVPIYKTPWTRKGKEGDAVLVKCIHQGENGDYWEVRFVEEGVTTEQRPWRWIWKAATVSDEVARANKSPGRKKKNK